MKIKILGTGCANCKTFVKTVQLAVNEMQINATVEKVEDITEIMSFKIMKIPALVINEEVILSGRLPKLNEIKEIITNYKK